MKKSARGNANILSFVSKAVKVSDAKTSVAEEVVELLEDRVSEFRWTMTSNQIIQPWIGRVQLNNKWNMIFQLIKLLTIPRKC